VKRTPPKYVPAPSLATPLPFQPKDVTGSFTEDPDDTETYLQMLRPTEEEPSSHRSYTSLSGAVYEFMRDNRELILGAAVILFFSLR